MFSDSHITMVISTVTVGASLWFGMWKIADTMKKDVEKKLGRNYDRLDEVKDFTENTFTRKDTCAILHKQMDEKLTDIRADVTDIRTDVKILIKNGNK